MKTYQKTLAGLMVCCTMGASTLAHAEIISHKNLTPNIEVKNFNNYEHREPCQQYKDLPSNVSAANDRCFDVETTDVTPALRPVIATYTIYFDFDKSGLNAEQQSAIQKLVQDVNTYKPSQITVTGHTDTSGSADYNKQLSAKRADTVSKTLASYNVSSFYLNEAALGEQDLAVPTPDDTKLSSNRRVVVQFRK